MSFSKHITKNIRVADDKDAQRTSAKLIQGNGKNCLYGEHQGNLFRFSFLSKEMMQNKWLSKLIRECVQSQFRQMDALQTPQNRRPSFIIFIGNEICIFCLLTIGIFHMFFVYLKETGREVMCFNFLMECYFFLNGLFHLFFFAFSINYLNFCLKW